MLPPCGCFSFQHSIQSKRGAALLMFTHELVFIEYACVCVCVSGGELYIGLYTDYWENDGALCRLNNQTYTRTERDDRQQLSGQYASQRYDHTCISKGVQTFSLRGDNSEVCLQIAFIVQPTVQNPKTLHLLFG